MISLENHLIKNTRQLLKTSYLKSQDCWSLLEKTIIFSSLIVLSKHDFVFSIWLCLLSLRLLYSSQGELCRFLNLWEGQWQVLNLKNYFLPEKAHGILLIKKFYLILHWIIHTYTLYPHLFYLSGYIRRILVYSQSYRQYIWKFEQLNITSIYFGNH